MPASRAFCLKDLCAILVLGLAAGCVLLGMAPQPHGSAGKARTFENLRAISEAAHFYRMSNNNYLPMVMCYTPRGFGPRPGNSVSGWCGWSFGGKNTSVWWTTAFGGPFDVEAADRPLSTYIYGDDPFYAPPYPQRLPANDPHRTSQQAEIFHDPVDTVTLQRNWPQPTPGTSCYDDVGTSYLTNMAWWEQLSTIPGFADRFNEGVRRIAVGQGASPSRFVWLSDQYGDLLANQFNPRYHVRNGHGDWNAAPLLFLDGHATYETVFPGRHTTATYTFWFE